MPVSWCSYRIFVRPADTDQAGAIDDYIALLREVVAPLLTESAPTLGRYYFQQFIGPYRFSLEDRGVTEPIGVAPDDVVHFVRLCVEADDYRAAEMFDRLTSLCGASTASLGVEVPSRAYDPSDDLGRRFGLTRADAVVETLQGASKLALLFATDGEPYDPTPNGQGGAAGLMHLLGLTLRYSVPGFLFENGMYHRMPLPCIVLDWQRELRYTSYPLP